MNSAANPQTAADTDSVYAERDNPNQHAFKPRQTLVKGRPDGTGLRLSDSTLFDTETSTLNDSSDHSEAIPNTQTLTPTFR